MVEVRHQNHTIRAICSPMGSDLMLATEIHFPAGAMLSTYRRITGAQFGAAEEQALIEAKALVDGLTACHRCA